MLGDLVAGKKNDGARIAAMMNPSAETDAVAVKIDTVKLGQLHAIVTKRPYKEVSQEHKLVAEGGEEGPWVSRVPDDLANALAALDAPGRKRIGRAWAKTEELASDHWSEDKVLEVLDAMCDLAARARKKKLVLFLWMSL